MREVSAWRDDVTAGVTTFHMTCDDVTAWRNSVTVTCNDVSAKRADTSPRREHVSLVVGFGRLDLRSGGSIWVYGGGGLPLADASQRAPDRPKSRFLSAKCLIELRICLPAGA